MILPPPSICPVTGYMPGSQSGRAEQLDDDGSGSTSAAPKRQNKYDSQVLVIIVANGDRQYDLKWDCSAGTGAFDRLARATMTAVHEIANCSQFVSFVRRVLGNIIKNFNIPRIIGAAPLSKIALD
jgi:hypothetical protein